MPDHNHIARGDVVGCPSCDVREGRAPDPTRVPAPIEDDGPTTPAHVEALPDATHRIVDERAVCDGGIENRCHWYPDLDECDHETWPCGHEYVFHADCWVIWWLNATDLGDSADDSAWEARIGEDEPRWPNGVIDWDWQGDYASWSYISIDADPAPSTLPDGRRDSDVPLWDDEAPAGALFAWLSNILDVSVALDEHGHIELTDEQIEQVKLAAPAHTGPSPVEPYSWAGIPIVRASLTNRSQR